MARLRNIAWCGFHACKNTCLSVDLQSQKYDKHFCRKYASQVYSTLVIWLHYRIRNNAYAHTRVLSIMQWTASDLHESYVDT